MKVTDSRDKGFPALIAALLKRGGADNSRVEKSVSSILDKVRSRGEIAVSEYTRRFDGVDVSSFEVTQKEIRKASNRISGKDIKLLKLAARRIKDFHKKQLQASWLSKDRFGALGVKVTPIERAGIYVPGGKAAYPSTVLMNAIPARVAGVDEVVMVTPPSVHRKDFRGINPYVLAAADIAGVDRVFSIGGAQAIGALAFGTETIPKVDKITGPGNIYVATAKRMVFGAVDIDMIAGPSEILVINDGSGDPSWIAADLLSQAEHDELASSILITTSSPMAEAVSIEVEKALKRLKRRDIAKASIERYGIIVIVKDLKEAARISNGIAPEHLELFVEKPFELLDLIRNAGAIFLGRHTPEASGDYLAGPNHTLPTGGTARFSSPLGVEDFIKRSSVINFTESGIKALGRSIVRFATLEGLYGHAKSVEARLRKQGREIKNPKKRSAY